MSLLSFSQLFETSKFKQPLYIAVGLTASSKQDVLNVARKLKIPGLINPDSFHCTLIYSSKPALQPVLYVRKIFEATVDEVGFFPTSNGAKRCCILKLQSNSLEQRHKSLMNEMEASYDYPSYIPHITLSYDCPQDYAVSKADQQKTKGLPIFLVGEYLEAIDGEKVIS